jgi:acylglycerol lipase
MTLPTSSRRTGCPTGFTFHPPTAAGASTRSKPVLTLFAKALTLLRRASFLLTLVVLAACAPLTQQAGRPELSFTGPRIEAEDFVSFDGTRLGLEHWDAPGRPWAVIVGLHGMNDYSNAFHLAGPWWAAHGITTWAFDQRGFGRSPHRGIWGGRELMEDDLRTLVSLARQRYPGAIVAVAGVSMGGAVAIDAFASDDPPAADRLVLLSPAVWGWSRQPLPSRLALWLSAHTFRGVNISPPDFITEHIHATDNIEELRRMGRDPLMLWGARPDALYGLMDIMQRGWRETAGLKVPTLYLYGAHDDIIPGKAAGQAAARLKPPDRTAYYAHGYHLLLVDLQAPVVYADVASFLADPAAPLPSGAPPIPATGEAGPGGPVQ